MSKTIVVVGYGPGISTAVADKFGAEGFAVALVGRTQERLTAGVAALAAKGVVAGAFVGDAGDPVSIRPAIARARAALGPISVIHWNAFSGGEAGDLLDIEPAAAGALLNVAVVGLLAAIQEALPDLKNADDAAILITNGAFGYLAPAMDALAINLKAMGVALANAAKAKLVGLLSERLKGDGIYVGEVTVAGMVKGTPYASEGGIEGSTVANKFWELYQARDAVRAQVS